MCQVVAAAHQQTEWLIQFVALGVVQTPWILHALSQVIA